MQATRRMIHPRDFSLDRFFFRKLKPTKKIPANGIPTANSGAERQRMFWSIPRFTFLADDRSFPKVLTMSVSVVALLPGVTVAGSIAIVAFGGMPVAVSVMAVANGTLPSGVSVNI